VELKIKREKCVEQQKIVKRFKNEIFYVIYCSVDQTSFLEKRERERERK
jgi:hypothetical protein